MAAHAALSAGSRMVLFDAKQVELGMWDHIADEFVGPDIDHAIITLLRLQKVMDNRYAWLRAHRRRKIEPCDGLSVITSIFDEIAVFSTVLGTEPEQRQFLSLLRDLVARGRAAAMPVVAATQRPIGGHHPQEPARPVRLPRRVPLHLHRLQRHHPRRRLVRRRILRHRHQPGQPRRSLLIAEGGIPQRIKVAYLSDADISALADYAAWTRRTGSLPAAGPATAVA